MPYIPPDTVAKARKMDLLTYLRRYEPDELLPFGRNAYCTRTHDSLKISNGKWFWFSRGIGGVSALDYLIKVKGIPFTQAVEQIIGMAAAQPSSFFTPKHPVQKTLLLPRASPCATHAMTYLTGRGIDPEIVEFCIRTRRLYESTPHRNVVFVGMDEAGKPRYANLRGICTDFIGEANGSDKRYSFNIPAQGESATLHLFESAIDLLSYATLIKRGGHDWRRDHLLSLAGIYESRNSVLPLALTHYLDGYPNITRVVLRLDNDGKGRLAAQAIQSQLARERSIPADIRSPPQGKDYNDYLCMTLGLPITKRRDKTKAR